MVIIEPLRDTIRCEMFIERWKLCLVTSLD